MTTDNCCCGRLKVSSLVIYGGSARNQSTGLPKKGLNTGLEGMNVASSPVDRGVQVGLSLCNSDGGRAQVVMKQFSKARQLSFQSGVSLGRRFVSMVLLIEGDSVSSLITQHLLSVTFVSSRVSRECMTFDIK